MCRPSVLSIGGKCPKPASAGQRLTRALLVGFVAVWCPYKMAWAIGSDRPPNHHFVSREMLASENIGIKYLAVKIQSHCAMRQSTPGGDIYGGVLFAFKTSLTGSQIEFGRRGTRSSNGGPERFIRWISTNDIGVDVRNSISGSLAGIFDGYNSLRPAWVGEIFDRNIHDKNICPRIGDSGINCGFVRLPDSLLGMRTDGEYDPDSTGNEHPQREAIASTAPINSRSGSNQQEVQLRKKSRE